MKTIDMIGLALGRLRTSRLRTALTMLGVIIGVASVVALVAVGQGSTANITDRLAGLGTNLLTVNAGSSQSAGTFGAAGSAESLTLTDAEALDTLSALAGVAPEISASQLVVAGEANTTTTIVGTTADYPDVRSFELWQGSGLTDISVENELRVAVIGSSAADDLGLGADAVGREIKIGGLPFLVTGILQAKGGSGFPGPRRPGPHPGNHPAEVLLGLGRRSDHRRQRRIRRRHRRRQAGHHRAAPRSPRAGRDRG